MKKKGNKKTRFFCVVIFIVVSRSIFVTIKEKKKQENRERERGRLCNATKV